MLNFYTKDSVNQNGLLSGKEKIFSLKTLKSLLPTPINLKMSLDQKKNS